MLNDYVKRYMRSCLVGAIIMVMAALMLMFFPETMINWIVRLFALGLAVEGIIHIVFYVMLDIEMRYFSNDLFHGIVAFGAGVIIFMNVPFFAEVMLYAVGAWLIFKGLSSVQMSLMMTGIVEFNYVYLFLTGLLQLVCGVLMIIHPFGTMTLLTRLTGIALLISEVFDLTCNFYILRQLDHSRRPRIY